MKRSIIIAVCAALALLAAPSAHAGGLDASVVPAKAQLVVHVDLEALRASKLAKIFSAKVTEAEKEVSDALKREGIPLTLKDLRVAKGVTFWAEGDDKERGALIITGLDARKIAGALRKIKGHRTVSSGGHVLHQIGDGFVGFQGKSVVVADDKSSVTSSIEVLLGRKKSIVNTGKARRLGAPKGVFVAVAFEEAIAKKIREEADSPLFHNVSLKRGTVAVGEKGANLHARAVLETTDAAGANQLHKLAAGAISFFSVASDNADLGKLLDGVDIKSSGRVVTFSLELPMKDLANIGKMLGDEHGGGGKHNKGIHRKR